MSAAHCDVKVSLRGTPRRTRRQLRYANLTTLGMENIAIVAHHSRINPEEKPTRKPVVYTVTAASEGKLEVLTYANQRHSFLP